MTCTKLLDKIQSNFGMQIRVPQAVILLISVTLKLPSGTDGHKCCQENCLSAFVNVSRILHHVIYPWWSFACSCSKSSED